MGGYVVSTPEERSEMLKAIGCDTLDALYQDVPSSLMVQELHLPAGLSELELSRKMAAIAGKNQVFPTLFRGAGAYRHYIPAVVKKVVSNETLVTAYTPYQAELSQGILQSIFEYQTMMAQLTGLDVSNASVYDGATAAAEAIAMCKDRKRSKTLVSACAHPDTIKTMQTYCFASGSELVLVPQKDGATDLAALQTLLDAETCCVYAQQPNFYGLLEDMEQIGAMAHEAGAKFVMGCNPIALSLLKAPGECAADIATGEAQPLGMHFPLAARTVGL